MTQGSLITNTHLRHPPIALNQNIHFIAREPGAVYPIKMARTGTYLKMLVVYVLLHPFNANDLQSQANAAEHSRGVVVCVGGPALVQYVRPTDEELFKVRSSFRYGKKQPTHSH